jgi:hypothetical protein
MHFDHDEHGHTHEHEHSHEHEHLEATCGEPIHCGEGVSCDGCSQKPVSPREELIALMKYMIGHNASHAQELQKLAEKVKDLGESAAYEQILQAVGDFEKGNLRLSAVLASMTK